MDIDLNADLGEGAGFDAELMPLVTSANVCCGLHAGGPSEIRATLELARRHGVAIGAHPGYSDRDHFGRRELALSRQELVDLCTYQVAALDALARGSNLELRYIKAHGALYNQACRDEEVAVSFSAAAAAWNLPVVGLPGSKLEIAAKERGLVFIAEGFADRRYRPDGSLAPRREPDAFIGDPEEAVRQVKRLIGEQGVRTVCVHGDNPQAVAFAKAVREALLARGFILKPFA
jgi:5-oxoprolinase (ATP-hydrolysing) subunit A